MNILQQAQAKREALQRELSRIEAFLATAYELQQEFGHDRPVRPTISDATKADAPAKRTRSPATGSGSVTLRAVLDILRERGQPLSTRELLPLVQAKGIEVGGKDSLATLSARISQKGPIAVKDGKWWFVSENETSVARAAEEEATGISFEEPPAASLFTSNQESAEDAAALTKGA